MSSSIKFVLIFWGVGWVSKHHTRFGYNTHMKRMGWTHHAHSPAITSYGSSDLCIFTWVLNLFLEKPWCDFYQDWVEYTDQFDWIYFSIVLSLPIGNRGVLLHAFKFPVISLSTCTVFSVQGLPTFHQTYPSVFLIIDGIINPSSIFKNSKMRLWLMTDDFLRNEVLNAWTTQANLS